MDHVDRHVTFLQIVRTHSFPSMIVLVLCFSFKKLHFLSDYKSNTFLFFKKCGKSGRYKEVNKNRL